MEAFQTMMDNPLIVERSDPVVVLPEQEIPGGPFFLSSIDQSTVFFMSTVYSFETGGANVVDVIKQALSKVLVHYYPLAGRLTKDSRGKLTVDCSKKLGVPFVEASANSNIENLGDMRFLHSNVVQKLVYRDPTENMLEVAPLLIVQVTKFRCGGFTMGISINHCMVDLHSLKNFMNSWAELARGEHLSLIPNHDRTVLKSRIPPQITGTFDVYVHMSDVSNLTALYEKEQILWKAFHFDEERLATLKKMATPDGQGIRTYSSFVALATLVWRARNMALKMIPRQLSKLIIAVDFRSKLKQLMPGYFGNAIGGACCLCTAGELINEPMSSTAQRIKQAIARVDEEYVRSQIDLSDMYRLDAFSPSSLMVTSWQRHDHGSTDFGWGKPRSFGKGDLPSTVCVFMTEGKGAMVALGLPVSAMNSFEELVQSPASMGSRARL